MLWLLLVDVASHDLLALKRMKGSRETNFREILHITNFDVICTANCPNESFDKFITLYSSAYEHAFPLKRIKPNRKYIMRESWVNDELLNKKSNLFIKKLKSVTDINVHNYKDHLKIHNKLRRTLKSTYYQEIIEANTNDMKSTWKILNKAIDLIFPSQ